MMGRSSSRIQTLFLISVSGLHCFMQEQLVQSSVVTHNWLYEVQIMSAKRVYLCKSAIEIGLGSE